MLNMVEKAGSRAEERDARRARRRQTERLRILDARKEHIDTSPRIVVRVERRLAKQKAGQPHLPIIPRAATPPHHPARSEASVAGSDSVPPTPVAMDGCV